jgi:hypothetical protein
VAHSATGNYRHLIAQKRERRRADPGIIENRGENRVMPHESGD